MDIKFVLLSETRSFGVELELRKSLTQAKIRDAILAVDKEREVRVSPTWRKTVVNLWWDVKTDGTCGDAPKDGGGWEVASPILNGPDHLSVLGDVVKKIEEFGGTVNNNCGLHVHIGAQNFKYLSHVSIANAWVRIEPYFLQMLPKSRRENKFCANLRNHLVPSGSLDLKAETLYFLIEDFCLRREENRRVSLNFMNYVRSGYSKTSAIELRSPEGTTSSNDVKNWVRFMSRLVSENFSKKIERSTLLQTSPVNSLDEFYKIVGLSGNKEDFNILSSGMRKCKIWTLNRFLKYSESSSIRKEAEVILDSILNFKNNK